MARSEPNWQLLLRAAEALTSAGCTPFTRAELFELVWESDPSRLETSLSPVVQGMTINASGGPTSACGPVLERVARGKYRLIEPGERREVPAPWTTSSTPSKVRGAERVARNVGALETGFDRYVATYDSEVPFRRSGQYELHRATIDLRYELGSAAAALHSAEFVDLLARTLNAWGIGRRRSRIVSPERLHSVLWSNARRMDALDGLSIERLGDDARVGVEGDLWSLVETLGVVDNAAKIVAGTKTLHHILPDLMVPMDRRYTGEFFRWGTGAQYEQERVFRRTFGAFADIAARVTPSRLVGEGWRTSQTKILDNAVIGFVLAQGNY